MKRYKFTHDNAHGDFKHVVFGTDFYLASDVDARITEMELALRYLREEIESDGNPGWTALVEAIDRVSVQPTAVISKSE